MILVMSAGRDDREKCAPTMQELVRIIAYSLPRSSEHWPARRVLRTAAQKQSEGAHSL